MLTLKLPYRTSDENQAIIAELQRQQSSLTRFIYARLEDGLPRKDIALLASGIFQLDSWFIQSSYMKAKALYATNKCKSHKHIWGGRKNFFLRSQGKLTREEFRSRRLIKIHVEGESPQRGNRKFDLKLGPETNSHHSIIFKPKAGQRIELGLPKIRRNWLVKLLALQELANDRQMPYKVELDQNFIYISFQLDEASRLKSIVQRPTTKKEVRSKAKLRLELLKSRTSDLQTNRIMGIDLNPNFIGLSVLEFDEDDRFKVIHKEVIDFSELNMKDGFSNDKKVHESIEASKYIANLAKHYDCSKLAIEDLNIKSSNKGIGKRFNRLCNNVWHRKLITAQLNKRCQEHGIEFLSVNAAYSSTVGNVLYGSRITPDMVASSIEVARRGYKKYNKGWFYPALPELNNLRNQWKEDLSLFEVSSWPELHDQIKNSGMRYRVPLDLANAKAVCRHKSEHSSLNRINLPLRQL